MRERTGKISILAVLVFALLVSHSCRERAPSDPCCRGHEPRYIKDSRHDGWRMVVIGDNKSQIGTLSELIEVILRIDPPPVMVVHSGDMIENPAGDVPWRLFVDAIKPLTERMPFYPVPGNHDIKSSADQETYKKHIKLPGPRTYYRIDTENARLLFLDTEMPGEDDRIAGEQMEWLEEQMRMLAGDTAFKMVFHHQLVFPAASFSHKPLKNHARLHELYRSGGVHAVFQGHDHLYDHQFHDGIHYFISAGGGAELVRGTHSDFFHFLLVTVGRHYLWVEAVSKDGEVCREAMVPRWRNDSELNQLLSGQTPEPKDGNNPRE